MQKIFFLLFIPALLLASCNNKTNQEEGLKPYFDLKKFFSAQANTLGKEHIHLQKQINKDGKTEEKFFTQVDWQRELKPFSECDINKPAWVHSYISDTVFTTGKMQVKYIARDVSLPVKQINLSFENNILTRMNIHKESANSYYRSNNDYIFEPGKGFTINGSQDVMLARKTNYSIVAKFIK